MAELLEVEYVSISNFSPKSSRAMLSWFDPGRLPPGRSLETYPDELDHFLALSSAVSAAAAAVPTASEQLPEDRGRLVEVPVLLLK